MLLLYYVLIQTHILYSITLWGSTCSTYKNKLKTLQNSAIRAKTKARNMQRISSNYLKCGILKIDDLYKFITAKLMFQYTKNDLPKPFKYICSANPLTPILIIPEVLPARTTTFLPLKLQDCSNPLTTSG